MPPTLEYSTSDLMAEIRFAYGAVEGKSVIDKALLMVTVMRSWEEAPTPRDLFFRHESVGDAVDRFIRSLRRRTDSDQPPLPEIRPGFEHLQEKYVITRGGEQVIVALDEMSNEEIEAKAREHERMAEGHLVHADELRRYRRDRGRS